MYIITEDAYLALDGETVAVSIGNAVRCIPLHTLESIVCFSYKGASPALMGKCAENDSALRGIEGNAAAEYFGVFDQMVLKSKDCFSFTSRNRHPPTDPVNALLSFAYSLLANDCAAALQSVGLDPYSGFLHTDRPGRKSLALDLMEELRAPFADRFVLYLINNHLICKSDFDIMENSAVYVKDSARRGFLDEWQKRKKDEITHPFLEEKIPWGLVPYSQALLLARYVHGDLDGYPPFFWK